MNDDTTDLDQADEEILTYNVSDEELEAAATNTQLEVTQIGYKTCNFCL